MLQRVAVSMWMCPSRLSGTDALLQNFAFQPASASRSSPHRRLRPRIHCGYPGGVVAAFPHREAGERSVLGKRGSSPLCHEDRVRLFAASSWRQKLAKRCFSCREDKPERRTSSSWRHKLACPGDGRREDNGEPSFASSWRQKLAKRCFSCREDKPGRRTSSS